MPIDAFDMDDQQLLLGRYRILEQRGAGGFGAVVVCWDPRLMRRVAIKTIPLANSMAPQATLRAALAETRTASMLSHPNIVQMLDFEHDDDNAYIIMEYVEGASLAEILEYPDGAPLTPDEAAAVVEAVCDALQFAHENGVLHLDIKPGNILVEASGRVKLADFGMAALSSATGFSGARGGTVGYMPPEQANQGAVDVRTDVFAFACVMYEALTGIRPFGAPSIPDSLDLVYRGAADPCAVNQEVDPQTADALLVALDPDPAIRPESAEALGNEMLAGLGRPKAGRKSLADLVAQMSREAQGDTEPAKTLVWDGRPAPEPYDPGPEDPLWKDRGCLTRRSPRAATWTLRAAGALGCGFTAVLALLAALPGGQVAAVGAGLAIGAVGLAVPQLASALALAALLYGCFRMQLWLCLIAVAVVGVAWWVTVARVEPLRSGVALCVGIAPQAALPASSLVCGYLLDVPKAVLSALLATVVAGVFASMAGLVDPTGFQVERLLSAAQGDLPQAARAAVQALASPHFWFSTLCWTAGAAAASLLCNGVRGMHCETDPADPDVPLSRPRPKWLCYVGAFAALAAAVACSAALGLVEKGASWQSLSPETLAAAVGSSIIVALIAFLLGAPQTLDFDGVADADSSQEDR